MRSAFAGELCRVFCSSFPFMLRYPCQLLHCTGCVRLLSLFVCLLVFSCTCRTSTCMRTTRYRPVGFPYLSRCPLVAKLRLPIAGSASRGCNATINCHGPPDGVRNQGKLQPEAMGHQSCDLNHLSREHINITYHNPGQEKLTGSRNKPT
jgi:hypothetical protein